MEPGRINIDDTPSIGIKFNENAVGDYPLKCGKRTATVGRAARSPTASNNYGTATP